MLEQYKYIKDILIHYETFFKKIGPQSIGELYKFYVALVIILALELSLFNYGILGKIIQSPILAFLVSFIIYYLSMITIGFLSVLFGTAITHLIVILFGGKDYKKTLTAAIIGSTPFYLFGGIEFLNIFAGVYVWVLLIYGLSELHKFSKLKAFFIILISGIILGIILAIIYFLIVLSLLIFLIKTFST